MANIRLLTKSTPVLDFILVVISALFVFYGYCDLYKVLPESYFSKLSILVAMSPLLIISRFILPKIAEYNLGRRGENAAAIFHAYLRNIGDIVQTAAFVALYFNPFIGHDFKVASILFYSASSWTAFWVLISPWNEARLKALVLSTDRADV